MYRNFALIEESIEQGIEKNQKTIGGDDEKLRMDLSCHASLLLRC